MQDGLLFVRSVGAHMITLLAGCAATVVLELFRRFVLKRDFPNRWYAWILSGFLCFAFFQAWEEQYTSAESRAHVIYALSADKARLEGELHGEVGRANAEVGGKAATIDALKTQISSQQVAINQCLVQLGKAQQAEPLKMTMLPNPIMPAGNTGRYLTEFIILTNKSTQHVSAMFGCDRPMRQFQADVMGRSSFNGGSGVIGPNTGHLDITTTPAWSSTNPLLIKIWHDDSELGNCRIRVD